MKLIRNLQTNGQRIGRSERKRALPSLETASATITTIAHLRGGSSKAATATVSQRNEGNREEEKEKIKWRQIRLSYSRVTAILSWRSWLLIGGLFSFLICVLGGCVVVLVGLDENAYFGMVG